MTRTFALLLALALPCSALAQGRTVTRPALPHAHDDRSISFGNTLPAPDVTLGWETTGTDYMDIGVPGDSCLIVSSDPGTDRTALTCTDTRMCVCSDDAVDTSECLCFSHNETRAVVSAANGADQILFDSDSNFVGVDGTANALSMLTASDVSSRIGARQGSLSAIGYQFYALFTPAQLSLDLSDGVGNQLVINNSGGSGVDCAHAATTDPTLFLHSDTSCGSSTTEWLGLYHDQTSAQITTGAGNLILDPISDVVSIGPGTKHSGRFVQTSEIQTTDATPTACAAITLTADQAYQITADVVAIQSDGAQSAGYKAMATFTKDGAAAAAAIGSTWVVAQESDAAMDLDIVLSGDNAQVLVTGRASTMEWGCTTTYSRINP